MDGGFYSFEFRVFLRFDWRMEIVFKYVFFLVFIFCMVYIFKISCLFGKSIRRSNERGREDLKEVGVY